MGCRPYLRKGFTLTTHEKLSFSTSCWVFFAYSAHTIVYMLETVKGDLYKVKDGQTLKEIAEYFSVSLFLLAKINGLTAEPKKGQVLRIPKERGNAYTVREGDTKALLCGSEENYLKRNGTDVFYIGMRVIL